MLSDKFLGNQSQASVFALYSQVPKHLQKLSFAPVKQGTKIVLSTNVAETSVTIPDVVHVVDTGIVKELRYKAGSGMKDLVTVWISEASMKQRCGRAGRVQSGHCWRLFSQDTAAFTPFTLPEIFRTPLEDLILQVLLLEELNTSAAVEILPWLDSLIEPPARSSVVLACGQLLEVGAIVNVGKGVFRLSPLGYHLSHLPMDVRVAKILVNGCLLSCLDPSLKVASILSATKALTTGHVRGPGVTSTQER